MHQRVSALFTDSEMSERISRANSCVSGGGRDGARVRLSPPGQLYGEQSACRPRDRQPQRTAVVRVGLALPLRPAGARSLRQQRGPRS